MPIELNIAGADLKGIIDHARRGWPDEVCGLVGGHWLEGQRRASATRVIPIANVSPAPTVRFEMARPAMVRAILSLEQNEEEVVAIYHSHPESAAIPSESDVAEATWPDALYILVGFVQAECPDVRVWSIQRRQAVPARLCFFGL